MTRVFLCWIGILALLSGAALAGPDHGVTARLVPDHVRPGDVFELRVEMDRPDYARFELHVPPQKHLHRVAVESEPVSFEAGRYRQRESWFLQADRSGEIVVKGAAVKLMAGGAAQEIALPALRLVVAPYAEADTSSVPLGLPPAPKDQAGSRGGVPWWVVGALLALAAGVGGWWIHAARRPAAPAEPDASPSVERVLEDLRAGRVPAFALQRLMDEAGADWPPDLREATEKCLYSGRGDPARLAELLEKEVDR